MRRAILPGVLCFVAQAAAAGSDTPDLHIDLTPTQITARCRDAEAAVHAAIKAALADTKSDALARLVAIETATGDYADALVDPQLLAEVSADTDVREAATPCSAQLTTLLTDLAADPAVHALAVAAAKLAQSQDDKQLAKLYVEAGRRGGADLPAAKRAAVTAAFKRLDAIAEGFQQRLAADRTTIDVTRDEAATLPEPFKATLEATDTGYRVPVDLRTHDTFLKNTAASAARKRYLTAFFQRGAPENSARVAEAVAVRAKLARQLGYATWADYQLAGKMAGTPRRALALVRDVDAALLPKAKAEIAALSRLKAERGDATPFAAWDYLYWEDQLERSAYAVDAEEVRTYFPATRVIPAVFEIYAHLFGVKFARVADAPEWAAGVQAYAIRDGADDRLLGWIYLDLVPRDGKFLRPANFALRQGHRRADGGYTLPISMIIGAGPAAAPGQPALFSHRDVVEYFHEFGHVMHTTLGTTPYWRLYAAGVRGDFVEAPSQMLENWMWQPSVLKRVSAHVDTGAPLPDALIERMLKLKDVADGVFWTRQAFLASYDLALHKGEKVDPDALWNTLLPTLCPLPALPGAKPAASFMPLFGYDAGYYGYLWSRVAAQDMFSAFQREGLDDPQVGMRYRRTILAPGGSDEPDVLVRAFLGRPMTYDAFYAELGIAR